MSTLSVNTIQPLSGTTVTIPSDLTVNGNIIGNISGSVTIGGLLTVDSASNTTTIIGSVIISGSNTLHNVGAMTTGQNCFVSTGSNAMAQGLQTIAIGSGSHAEGGYAIYDPNADAVIPIQNGGNASGMGSHAEGTATDARGIGSHAEGASTVASGAFSHAEGGYITASVDPNTNQTTVVFYNGGRTFAPGSHAEGASTRTLPTGWFSHAEGYNTRTAGYYSHAEGRETRTDGTGSHSEGYQTSASADYSHAEGNLTIALGNSSHAEGNLTTASGQYSHAEGSSTIALGNSSHAGGRGTIASGSYQYAIGFYNTQGDTTSPFIVGNGQLNTRKDAFKVSTNSSIIIPQTQSIAPAWTGTDGEIIPATVGGQYLLYMWMNGAWRSGSFV